MILPRRLSTNGTGRRSGRASSLKRPQSPRPSKRAKEQRDQARAESAELKAENDALKARLNAKEPEAPPKQQAQAGKPLLKDFETADEWEEAKYEWRIAQKAQADRLDAHDKRMAEAKKAYGDKFDEAIGELDGIKISTAAHDALIESDLSGEILFYLGTNAEEAEKLSALDAVKQIKEIGRLEAKLALSKEAQTEKPAPKAVKGPPAPIKPLTGGKSPGASATDWMGAEDYEVYRAGRKRAAAAQQ